LLPSRALLELIRPWASILMGAAVLVGAFLGDPNISLFSLKTLFSCITGFSLTAAAMALNDYFDCEVDAINEPSRPLPSNSATMKSAIIITTTLSGAGLVFSYLTSIICLAVATAAVIIMLTYSTFGKQKGLLGNLLVSMCIATPILYGSLAVSNGIQLNALLFASIAFLMNTGREITKTIVDLSGDRAKNVKTFAVVYGEKRAAVAATAFYSSTVCLSFIPIALHLVSIWFTPFALAIDLILLYCSVVLVSDPSRENARSVKKTVFKLFVVGLLAFVTSVL